MVNLHRFLIRYVVLYILFATFLFIFVRSRKENLFDQKTLEIMLTTPSVFKGVVTDPCQYYLKGEPRDFPDNYAKVIIYCSPSKSSANSLALPALKNHRLLEVINELGRLHGFTVESKGNTLDALGSLKSEAGHSWKCFNDLGEEKVIVDINHTLVHKQVIKCYYLSAKGLAEYKRD